MPLDDVSLYFDPALGAAEVVLLDGASVNGIFSTSAEVALGEVVTVAPTFLMQAGAAAEGQPLVRGGSTYRVRQVLPQEPDGEVHLLILSRVTA